LRIPSTEFSLRSFAKFGLYQVPRRLAITQWDYPVVRVIGGANSSVEVSERKRHWQLLHVRPLCGCQHDRQSAAPASKVSSVLAIVRMVVAPTFHVRTLNPSDSPRFPNALTNLSYPLSAKRSTQCQLFILSGTSHSSSLAGIRKIVPGGFSCAASRAYRISFCTNPSLVMEDWERQMTTTSLARTALRISVSHSCPGIRSSSSNQGEKPS
jgi:hypothetical protein